MSDSFADLWSSSAPSKPVQPQKLGAGTPNVAQKRPQQDVFALLSSAGSSAPSSRPITPSMAALSSQPKPAAPKPASKTSSGGDAFSELLGGTLAGGSRNGAHMTIAERAAQVEKQRSENLLRHQQKVDQSSKAWDGLDTLANSASSSAVTPSINLEEDDWGFGAPMSNPTSRVSSVKAASPPVAEDDWGLGDFGASAASKSRPPPPASPTRSHAIWDLDEFSSQSKPSSSTRMPSPGIPAQQRSDSPGDFDFGNREDALLDDDSNDEDDILGALSKPVDSIPKRKLTMDHSFTSSSPEPRPPSIAIKSSPSRPVSPPPHVLGRIVEMGFSVQQARVALASTDTGLDVEAALEILLSNGTASSSRSTPQPQPQSPDALPRGQQQRSATRERLMPNDRNSPSPSNSQLERDKERNIQEQADKLIAQASEIGLSVFNKASSFWKEGRERVQKAYEERAATATRGGASDTRGGNGRPKWMQEAPDADDTHNGWEDDQRTSGFSDEVLPQRPPQRSEPKAKKVAKPETYSQPQTPDLFSNEPAAYTSPFRRPKPQVPATTASPTPPRAPSPVRIVKRPNVVSASTSSISRSTKHKDLGAEKFKLGQYGDAEAAYTSAIACLPDTHLLLVPLYNNRALTRLKTGDHSGAVEDATKVMEIIGVGYHPAREAKVDREQEGSSVDLGDGLVKALKRRAEAWEGKEKWEEAGKDWEALAAADWAKGSLRGDAVRGVGRCRRMTQAASNPATESQNGPRTKPPPPPPPIKRKPGRAAPPSQALSNLRNVSNAAEAEDQQRHELKDSVDAKLTAWKGGKETNIRALIGSLDTVLWPELGLQKVGMADLVTPSQVKIRYTKTIAKLHPDKLNTNNTTVEQRMIANGVFGTLNEAWNAFKQ